MSRNLKLSFVKLWFCTSRISQSPIESVRPRSFLSFGFFTVLLQEPRSRVQVLDMLMIDLLLCLFAGILSIGIGDTCFLRQVQIALWISPPIRFMSAGAACRTLGVGFSKASVGIPSVYEKPNWG
ncbi:uncharacterized protein [Euphorbia lathyris]|uniref:uncharacterized protein isoform X11 n=1 Tax=Euphorbia lathyris TaxID=212925 RepID=UPI003313F5EA